MLLRRLFLALKEGYVFEAEEIDVCVRRCIVTFFAWIRRHKSCGTLLTVVVRRLVHGTFVRSPSHGSLRPLDEGWREGRLRSKRSRLDRA